MLLHRTASLSQESSGEPCRREIQLTSLAFRLRIHNGDTQCIGIASVSASSTHVADAINRGDQETKDFAWTADECEGWFFSHPDAPKTPSTISNQWIVRYAGYQQVADPLDVPAATSGRCDATIAARLSQLALDASTKPHRIEQHA